MVKLINVIFKLLSSVAMHLFIHLLSNPYCTVTIYPIIVHSFVTQSIYRKLKNHFAHAKLLWLQLTKKNKLPKGMNEQMNE